MIGAPSILDSCTKKSVSRTVTVVILDDNRKNCFKVQSLLGNLNTTKHFFQNLQDFSTCKFQSLQNVAVRAEPSIIITSNCFGTCQTKLEGLLLTAIRFRRPSPLSPVFGVVAGSAMNMYLGNLGHYFLLLLFHASHQITPLHS
jgi:hypothetical protein